MTRKVDLVLVFRSYSGKVLTKPQARENARQATEQYKRLLDTLKNGGLRAVGKRGEREGQLLVLVACPRSIVTRLAQRERYRSFALWRLQAVIHWSLSDIQIFYVDSLRETLHPPMM